MSPSYANLPYLKTLTVRPRQKLVLKHRVRSKDKQRPNQGKKKVERFQERNPKSFQQGNGCDNWGLLFLENVNQRVYAESLVKYR